MTEAERIREYFAGAKWRPSAGRDALVRERLGLLLGSRAHLKKPVGDLSVCDIGCGGGLDLEGWRDAGVPEDSLAGTELIAERVATARTKLPTADIRGVDGFALPFTADSFDVCSASLVLSTIVSEPNRKQLLAEMARVTRPGGLVLVYDFAIRKPWNHNVVAITTRGLTRLWKPPNQVLHAAPFLPFLGLALRLRQPLRRWAIAVLPRTHRLWVWRMSPIGTDAR
jgi:ubiquinone/menaquinone biosynthesis C-methylase UbiE